MQEFCLLKYVLMWDIFPMQSCYGCWFCTLMHHKMINITTNTSSPFHINLISSNVLLTFIKPQWKIKNKFSSIFELKSMKLFAQSSRIFLFIFFFGIFFLLLSVLVCCGFSIFQSIGYSIDRMGGGVMLFYFMRFKK